MVLGAERHAVRHAMYAVHRVVLVGPAAHPGRRGGVRRSHGEGGPPRTGRRGAGGRRGVARRGGGRRGRRGEDGGRASGRHATEASETCAELAVHTRDLAGRTSRGGLGYAGLGTAPQQRGMAWAGWVLARGAARRGGARWGGAARGGRPGGGRACAPRASALAASARRSSAPSALVRLCALLYPGPAKDSIRGLLSGGLAAAGSRRQAGCATDMVNHPRCSVISNV